MIHFKKHQVKYLGGWGYSVLCGKVFTRRSSAITNSLMSISCQICLSKLINKKEKELDYLKWALNDRKEIGQLRLPKIKSNEGILNESK